DNPYFKPVTRYTLNPKAVSMGDLYGEVSPLTLEWRDGLVPWMVCKSIDAEDNHRKWITFDGPVDAIWIENMNSVLDDNKLLCLNNGERIKLAPSITMLFEVEDLAVASPATVSRCGMVFLEPNHVGWLPLLDTWKENLEKKLPGKSEYIV